MLSRIDFLLNKGKTISFIGGEGAVFLQQLQLDFLSRQSKNIYFFATKGTFGGIYM